MALLNYPFHRPAVAFDQAQHDLDRGALASAVGPYVAYDFPPPGLKIDAPEDFLRAKAHLEVLQGEDRLVSAVRVRLRIHGVCLQFMSTQLNS